VYTPGVYKKYFWVPPGVTDQELQHHASRIDMHACYCSIFDECWLMTRFTDPTPVRSCYPLV